MLIVIKNAKHVQALYKHNVQVAYLTVLSHITMRQLLHVNLGADFIILKTKPFMNVNNVILIVRIVTPLLNAHNVI